ncbi:MAG: SDR family NAD(P)-dependent oxidoreductase [Pseudomonadota bacterium]
MKDLDNQVVLVTGASRGIGLHVAKAAAREGAQLILMARTVAALEALADDIEANGGRAPLLQPIDFRGATWEDYLSIAGSLESHFQAIDACIFNAAALGEPGPLAGYALEAWASVMQVNVNAPFLLLNALLPLLRRSKHARVIFSLISTCAATRAFAGAYGVSKAALRAMVAILSDEFESDPGLSVFGIDPGPVDTALYRLAYPGADFELLAKPQDAASAFIAALGGNN